MKPTLTLLGKGSAYLSEVSVSVQGDRCQWSNRLIRVEGPVPEELKGRNGSLPVRLWPEELAGRPIPNKEEFGSYVQLPMAGTWLPVTNDGESLGKAIASIKHMLVQDGPRNYGSVVNCANNEVVATDGHRLSFVRMPILNACMFPFGTLALALKLLKKGSSVQISEDGTMIRICSGQWTALLRASNVKYPSYASVLPTTGLKSADPDNVAKALERAKLLAKCKWDPKNPAFAELATADEGTIMFNPKYFCELEGFELKYTDKDGPLQGVKGNQVYILVPVKGE